MERVRDRFADRPPRPCFQRTCSSSPYTGRSLSHTHPGVWNRNLDAHEYVNIEFSGLPYVCAGEVLCVLACRSRRLIPLDLDGT